MKGSLRIPEHRKEDTMKLTGDWTKLKPEDVDTKAFLRRLERMKAGEGTECPFCDGTVYMTRNENGTVEYACDTCDMKITTETK